MNLTKEEFESWRALATTREIFDFLAKRRDEEHGRVISALIGAQSVDSPQPYKVAGIIAGLNELLELDFDYLSSRTADEAQKMARKRRGLQADGKATRK